MKSFYKIEIIMKLIYLLNTKHFCKTMVLIGLATVFFSNLAIAQTAFGNRVWNDLDGDGWQDANEQGISGVVLQLYQVPTNGTAVSLVGTTTSSATGTYSFGAANVTGGLQPGTTYQIRVARGQTALAGLNIAPAKVGNGVGASTADKDSDGFSFNNTYYVIPFVTQATAGAANNDYDIGFSTAVPTNISCWAFSNNELPSRMYKYDFNPSTGVGGWATVGTAQANFNNIEATAYNPFNSTLYVTNGADFSSVNQTTAQATVINNAGTVNGAFGSIALGDLDGLTYDPFRNVFWASERRGAAGETDLLVQLNATTGIANPNAFGAGIGYVRIQEVNDPVFGGVVYDVDDLALNPYTGELYAISNQGGVGGMLTILNTSNGDIRTIIGNFAGVNDMEGLSFSNPGVLYGTTGNNGDPEDNNRTFLIDKSTGFLVDVGPIDNSTNPPNDIEACVCATGGINTISGTVYIDANRDLTLNTGETGIQNVTVSLIQDLDNDGVYDPSIDKVIFTKETAANGTYNFQVATTGAFLLITDVADYPAGYTMTTDNIEKVYFNGLGQSDPNNNFGAAPAAKLGNRVWLDANKNGVQDATEVGVAGVTVTLYNAAGIAINTTVTDGLGNYLFDNLAPGDYSTGFTLPVDYTFTTQDTGTDNAADSDVNPTTGRTANITIASGVTNLSLDAGLILAQPTTASLGNFIWLDANKDGLQTAGETGVAGITVTLYNSAGVAIKTTTTDGNGAYNFTDLTPGTYTVGITTPLDYVLTTANAGTNDNIDSDLSPTTGRSAAITLVAGEKNTSLDAGIFQQPNTVASLGNKVWRDLNNNNTQDANEPGVSGVTVTLYAADGTTVVATTVTDALGIYVFNNLPAATNGTAYIVGFSGLPTGFGFVTANSGDDAKDSDANATTGKTNQVVLKPNDINSTVDAGIRATNPAGTASVSNMVFNDTNKDGLQTAGETGVSGVTVTLYNAAGTAIATTTTDGSGAYIFAELAAGTYSVGFSNLPAGYQFTSSNVGTNDAIDSDTDISGRTATFTLAAAENKTDLDAGIFPGTVSTGNASLSNMVFDDKNNNGIQDSDESGVANVSVRLLDAAGNPTGRTTTTDALGNYSFTNLPAGSYIVEFLNLPAGYTFSNANTGANDNIDSDASATTGRTSIISLTQGEDNSSVDAGIHKDVTKASLGSTVFVDANNNGIQDAGEPGGAGVKVVLLDENNAVVATTFSDANGNYSFTGLNPGFYSVQFSQLPTGYVFATANAGTNDAIDSDPNATTGQTTSTYLTAGQNYADFDAGIRNTQASLGDFVWADADRDGIQDAGETGIAGIVVTLYNSAGTAIATTITDANGKYIFSNVAPGTYTLGFDNLPEGGSFSPTAQGTNTNLDSNVNPATGRTPNIVLTAGTATTGVDAGIMAPQRAGLGNYVWTDADRNGVQDPSESGLAGVTVQLFNSANQLVATVITDANGMYNFSNIAPGTYYVQTTPPNDYFVTGQAAGGNASADSDVNPTTGRSANFTLATGSYNTAVDIGMQPPLSLPVTYLGINVYAKNKQVFLDWATSSEINNDYFSIEKAQNTSASPEKIGTVMGNGNSNQLNKYDFIDAQPLQGKSYYRLIQNDYDGKQSVSKWFEVLFVNGKIALSAVVYPNPATDLVNLKIVGNALDQVNVVVYNLQGQAVIAQSVVLTQDGENIQNITTSELQSGVYMVRTTSNEATTVQKLVIEK